MSDSRILSTRIEKEYDPIRNEWDARVQCLLYEQALYSGFLAEIPPMQLHTLICLSLFMKENGKIEISVADLARALGISFHLAKKRIEELAAFRFRGKPVVHINRVRELSSRSDERISVSILPVSPVTITDCRDELPRSFSPTDPDWLFEYTRQMLNVPELPESDKELLLELQGIDYGLPPQVIAVLIDHVMDYKREFDRKYLLLIAAAWSNAGILTIEQAEKWVREKKLVAGPTVTDGPEAYLRQYLRDRIQKHPSPVQIKLIDNLLDEPFRFEPGCVEVLIDHVVAQITLSQGKPDFPRGYVEAVIHDWLEDGVRTREDAVRKVEEWNQRYSLKPASSGEKTGKRHSPPKSPATSKVRSEYLEKLRRAGLK